MNGRKDGSSQLHKSRQFTLVIGTLGTHPHTLFIHHLGIKNPDTY